MITITNKNIYHSDFSLSTLSDLSNIRNIHIGDIINFLSDNIELGESVTFKRLFDIVAYNVDKFNEIFYSSLGGYSLEPFLQEIENIPTEIIESEYLEIHWFCDKYDNELNISPSIHGKSTKSNDSYALDFVSLNNIKNNIVKLNKNVSIFDYSSIQNDDIIDKVDELINNIKIKDRLELGEKMFTLFEMYDAILDEISFHGGPQDKKEKFEELEEQIDEVKEGIKNDLTDSMTFKEMIDKIESKDKYLVKFKEQRDRVDKHRMNNKKNLSKLKNCLIEKLKIYDIIESSDENLEQYYKKLTDIEYNMQLLYGEEEDISQHLFWQTPKCTCPKIDNIEIYPSKNPIFDDKCQIHKKTS
jgi:hypothetical protein